jgi:hypothetical protein
VHQRTTGLCHRNHKRTYTNRRLNNIQPPPFSGCPKYTGQFGLCTSQVNVRYSIPERVTHRSATCVRMRKRNEGTGIHLNLVWSKCWYLHKTSMLSRHSQERDRLLNERQRWGTEDGSRDGIRMTVIYFTYTTYIILSLIRLIYFDFDKLINLVFSSNK